MASFDREYLLFDPIAAYTRRKSFRWQKRELPFYEYRVDLFVFSRVLHLTAAIELKLTKWRRAVEQAIVYQLCADHVFIAMPMQTIRRVDVGLLTKHGIGLIAVQTSGRCRQVLAPRQSAVVRQYYRDAYVEMLQGSSPCPR